MAEPLVQDGVIGLLPDEEGEAPGGIGGGEVAVLVEEELGRHPGLFIGLVHEVKLLGADVVVVQAVDNQGGALDVLGVQGVVPADPVVAVVAVALPLVIADLVEVVAVLLLDGGPVLRVQVPAGAVPGQPVGVSGVTVGGDALGVGVLIPAGDAGHGDDGLQALHAGGGQAELGGAGVGTTGHAHLAVGPIGLDLDVAGLVGVGHPVAGEPLDDALEGVDLQVGTAGLEPVGAAGTQAAALHHGIAADQVVVIPGQVLVVVHVLVGVIVVPLRGVGLGGHFFGGGLPHGGAGLGLAVELGDVIALLAVRHIAGGTAGDVGPGLIDGGGLIVPLHGGPGELHQGLHQVQLAVVVGVVVGFHVDEEPDDVAVGVVIALFHRAGGEGEDGLGHAVHKQGLSGLAVEGVIEHLGGLLHHCQVALGAGGGGRIALDAVGHTHAVGHGVVVSGVGAQLALFHARPAEQVGHSLLVGDRLVRLPGDWEGQVRAVGSQLPPGDRRAGVFALHSHGRGNQRQRQCQHQEQNGEVTFHWILTFFLKFLLCAGAGHSTTQAATAYKHTSV